jgi:hypothetical protein
LPGRVGPGRPRSAFIGTTAFGCFGASGRASGSVFAAARIALSSRAEGKVMAARLLDAFDMVFHFPPGGAAQADDPQRIAKSTKAT